MPESPPDAEARLWQQIDRAPDLPGAWLDLAVFYCENGQEAAAGRIFRLIEDRHAPPPGIRELIAHLRGSGCHGKEPPSARTHALHVRLLAGTDSNPNQGLANSSLTLVIEEQPVLLPLTAASRPIADQWQGIDLAWLSEGPGWQPFALGAFRRYRSQTAFDTDQLILGLHEMDNSGHEQRLGIGLTTLGGQLYSARIFSHHQRPLPWSGGLNGIVGVAYQDFPDYPEQNSLQLDLRLMLARKLSDRADARLHIGALIDQPTENRPGGTRHGLVLRADARHALAAPWHLEAQLHYRRLRDSAPYSPLFGDQRRVGDEWLGSIALVRALSRDSSLTLALQQEHASNAIPIFDLRRQQLILAFDHLFH